MLAMLYWFAFLVGTSIEDWFWWTCCMISHFICRAEHWYIFCFGLWDFCENSECMIIMNTVVFAWTCRYCYAASHAVNWCWFWWTWKQPCCCCLILIGWWTHDTMLCPAVYVGLLMLVAWAWIAVPTIKHVCPDFFHESCLNFIVCMLCHEPAASTPCFLFDDVEIRCWVGCTRMPCHSWNPRVYVAQQLVFRLAVVVVCTVALRANQSGYFVWPSKTQPFW